MLNNKNRYGQYMTPKDIVDFMVSLSNVESESQILEPCSGEGAFIKVLKERGFKNITAYEIDSELTNKNDKVINKSFISEKIYKKFDLVIGNPPYVRWKNLEEELKIELSQERNWNLYCNSLCDYSSIFIIKAIELLKNNGELIFITPEYWMNTTHSKRLRNYILDKGYISEIYHFNETPIFENVSVSLVIFKFIKSRKKKPSIKISKYYSKKKIDKETLNNLRNNIIQPNSEYIERPQFEQNENWTFASESILDKLALFEERCSNKDNGHKYTIKEFCNIGNGMVSGKDRVFQITGFNISNNENIKTINVVKAKDLKPYTYNNITKYIFINDIDSEEKLKNDYPNFFQHLNKYKTQLDKRYQYNKKIEYWKWVFLRNYNLFNNKEDRIFVPCKERISNKNHFRFAYVPADIFPTQDVTAIFKKTETEENLYYILAFLNSKYVFDWLKIKGIVKGSIVEFSEKPISSIPFRKIDFGMINEVAIHDDIVELVKEYLKVEKKEILDLIQNKFKLLLE